MGQTTRTIDHGPVIPRKLAPIPGKRGPGTGYRSEFAKVALGATIHGATHATLADLFDVDEDTITSWKRVHPAFRKAVEEGSRHADAQVAASFFKRACGYTTTVTRTAVREFRDTAGNIVGTERTITTVEQHVPADATAAWRWLQLRQRWYVRPTLTVQEIVQLAAAARREAARRGIDVATALALVQEPNARRSRCPTCGALRSHADDGGRPNA
jgi:hypothetical protein